MKRPLKIFKVRRKKTIILLLIVFLSIGIFLYAAHSLSKPAVGVVNQTVGQAPTETVTLKDFKNKFFTTKYSSRYELQTNKNPSASLGSWILLAHQALNGASGGQIVVSVTELPIGGVKEDSAYKQYEAFPDKYTLSKATYNLEGVVIATQTKPSFERTALWAHGKYLLTATMTSGQSTDQLTSEFDSFLGHVIWPEQ